MWLSVIYFPSYHKTKAECLSEALCIKKIEKERKRRKKKGECDGEL